MEGKSVIVENNEKSRHRRELGNIYLKWHRITSNVSYSSKLFMTIILKVYNCYYEGLFVVINH